ncbi:uncharacterized protein LOC117784145 [Drosophila innubila]|uniref:uncharacterized protein LOC117784145 n=1 Tax=Drosophila innubila TaxID=198719 RepID=UPI00148BF82C|nr:uncharacterized protein LOC117784145 [Drosophila innubila]
MADLPENLQVIKLEPPGTPEKSNIKERLNLHVKRRLQQEIPETPHNDIATATTNKRCKATSLPQSKEVQKSRKPYQKRVEKVKTDSSKCKKAQSTCAAADLETFEESADHEASPETSDSKNLSRDRYKNADILNIVLSRKKRALMHNPQVQLFWSQIMSALND